jgi:hypothetical protein
VVEVVEETGNAVGEVVDGAGEVVGDVVDAVTGAAEEGAEQAGNLINGAVDAVGDVATVIGRGATEVAVAVGEALDDPGAVVGSVIRGAGEFVEQSGTVIGESVKDLAKLVGEVGDKGGDFAEAVVNKGKDLVEDSVDFVTRVGSDLVEKGQDIAEETADFVGRVGTGIIDKGTDFLADVGSAAENVGEKVADAGVKIGGAVGEVGSTLLEAGGEILKSLVDASTAVANVTAGENAAEQSLSVNDIVESLRSSSKFDEGLSSEAIKVRLEAIGDIKDKATAEDSATERFKEAAEDFKARQSEDDNDKPELAEELPPSFALKLGIPLDDGLGLSFKNLDDVFSQTRQEGPLLGKGVEFGFGFTDPPRPEVVGDFAAGPAEIGLPSFDANDFGSASFGFSG